MKNLWTFLLTPFLLFAQTETNVMSYNIRLATVNDGENNWELRKGEIANLISYYEPEFLGLQEAQKPQIDYLLANLTMYKFIGQPREKHENAEYSCIFYNAQKFELIEQNTFWLSETPEVISKGWDAAYHRIVTYGLFKHKKTLLTD